MLRNVIAPAAAAVEYTCTWLQNVQGAYNFPRRPHIHTTYRVAEARFCYTLQHACHTCPYNTLRPTTTVGGEVGCLLQPNTTQQQNTATIMPNNNRFAATTWRHAANHSLSQVLPAYALADAPPTVACTHVGAYSAARKGCKLRGCWLPFLSHRQC